jgi:hypothetical protein
VASMRILWVWVCFGKVRNIIIEVADFSWCFRERPASSSERALCTSNNNNHLPPTSNHCATSWKPSWRHCWHRKELQKNAGRPRSRPSTRSCKAEMRR